MGCQIYKIVNHLDCNKYFALSVTNTRSHPLSLQYCQLILFVIPFLYKYLLLTLGACARGTVVVLSVCYHANCYIPRF